MQDPETKTNNVTLIEITMFQGKTIEAKKALYKAIANNLALDLGINGDDITIALYEPPLENWSVKGGKSANEVDFRFKIIV